MPATEFPPDVAGLLGRLRDRLAAREDVVGVYVYGSLVTGDYSPAASDIDVIVLVQRKPGTAMTRELTEMHTALAGTGGPAGQLHCLYVTADSASDPERLCTYWFGDRMTQWQMKLLTQAELASAGVALYGPWPPPGIKPVPVADLQAAVHAEITGYWRRISRKRRCWLQDSWVDHGLVVLPRAEAMLTTGDLITKSEAISRLSDLGVPGSLAQEIRRRRDGLPVTVSKPLVAWGSDWLITPLAPGSPLAWGEAVPANLVGALAALHACYHGAADLPAAIPRVTPAWWQALCREWVDPGLSEHTARHPPETTARARALVSRAAGHPAASAVLAGLPPTLLHGDVHPGNVLVHAGQATLIDWGSSRAGPAALDLANLVAAGSADVAHYARTWQQLTGQPLPAATIELGYRWAALQIPVQYLPWTAAHRPTRDVEAALDQIERALGQLRSLGIRDGSCRDHG